LQQVETFSKRDRWNTLSAEDLETVVEQLADLPNGNPQEQRLAKEFDLLCLKLQLATLERHNSFERLRDQVRDTLAALEQKRDIPMVKAQLPLITEAQEEAWWEAVTPRMVESLRLNLRELIQFIDRQAQATVYTNFADQMGDVTIVDVPTYQTGFSPYQYRKKVESYIRANEDHVAIAKLKRNLPLTETDLDALETMLFSSAEIESRERFEQVYGTEHSLKLFIRQLVGLDRNAAKDAFSQYLQGSTFSAGQIRFVETIIDYLTQNGIMNPGLLYEPPFTDLHSSGLDGVFVDTDADAIVSIIRSFNETVDARYDVS
jgi:type I restriction enzyme, R subunit